MRETVWHILVILSITGAVFFTNLGEARLWDRDEPRNAGCAAEMMARGDWVVPIFNDELRHQKPVLLYWLMMSAYSVLGVNEFSARFWSATLAIGTTLATYGIARRLTSPRIGLIAAVALSTSLMFDVAARAATPDSVLIFCSTSALMFYVLGTFSRDGNEIHARIPSRCFPSNIFMVIAMYAMMGLGVLAKGPVGFVLPMAIIGMFILVQTLPSQDTDNRTDSLLRRLTAVLISIVRPFQPVHFLRTFWAMKPGLAALVVLLIAAPWYVLVDQRTNGDFTTMFFVGEHFGRATTAMENHAGGFWYYPLALLVGFFPWSVFWGPVAVGLMGRRFRYPVATTLMLCFVGVQVGIFTLAQTKLPSYVTPCYPALAILTAVCLEDFSSRRSTVHQGWFFAAFAGFLLAGIVIVGGLGFAAAKFLPNQIWLAALGAIPTVAGGVLIWMLLKNQTRHLPTVFAGASAIFCWGLFGVGTTAIDGEQRSHLILDEVKSAPDESVVAAYGCLESSWVFYGGRPIHELSLDDPSNSDFPLPLKSKTPRRLFWNPKPRVSLEFFLNTHPGAMIITTDEHVDAIRNRLPEQYSVIQTADYFLKSKQIHLLGIRADRWAGRGQHQDDETIR